MRTSRIDGLWNLIDASGCLIKRGTWSEVTTAMRELW